MQTEQTAQQQAAVQEKEDTLPGLGEIAAPCVVFGDQFGQRWKGEDCESGPVGRRLTRGIGEDYMQALETKHQDVKGHPSSNCPEAVDTWWRMAVLATVSTNMRGGD